MQTGHEESDVMPTDFFLSHDVYMHQKRLMLQEIFDKGEYWVFAMGQDCTEVAMKLYLLHMERLQHPIQIVPIKIGRYFPAFFLFPQEQLRIDEVAPLLDIEISSLEEIEGKAFIVLSKTNPMELTQVIMQWLDIDHLLN